MDRSTILALMAGLALAFAGVWGWYRDSTPAASTAQLDFVPIDQELGPVLAGDFRKVSFRVINRDRSRPARILGIEQHCDREGCLFWRGAPTTIPPGGETTVEVEWKGIKAGRLVQHFPVYTDCAGQMEVRMTISGDVIEAAPSPSPSSSP